MCVCVCGKRRNLTWDSFPSFYSRAFEFSNGAAAGTGSNVCDTCTQAVAGEGILAPLGDTETVLCARPRPASSPPDAAAAARGSCPSCTAASGDRRPLETDRCQRVSCWKHASGAGNPESTAVFRILLYVQRVNICSRSPSDPDIQENVASLDSLLEEHPRGFCSCGFNVSEYY